MVTSVLLLLVSSALPQASFEAAISEARRLLEADAVSEAIAPLEAAIALRPGDSETLWMLSVANLQLGRPQDGYPYVRVLVEAEPGVARHHGLLAAYERARGDDAAALDAYRFGLEHAPEDPRLLHGLALTHTRRGEDTEAIAAFERILTRFPDDPRSLVPVGVLYFRGDRTTDALETLSRAVRAAPESFEAQHYLGAVYSKLGRYDLARSHLTRALQLREDDPESSYELGMVYARQEQLSEARQYFETARAGRPAHAETHFQLGGIYHYERELAAAEASYERVLELAPTHALAHFELGRLYAESGELGASLEHLRRSVELAPAAESHHQLARTLDRLERTDEARRHFEAAIALAPHAPEPRLNYGNFLLRHGEPERGRRELERFRAAKRAADRIRELQAAVNFDPTNAAFKSDLVDYLIVLERYDQALEESRRFLTLATMEPIHHVLVGRALAAQGELDEALAVLEEARRSIANEPVLEAHYAAVLARTGRVDDARVVLNALDDDAETATAWAWVYAASGDDDAADASFLRAIDLDAGNERRYRAYAGWLEARGRSDAAAAVLSRIEAEASR